MMELTRRSWVLNMTRNRRFTVALCTVSVSFNSNPSWYLHLPRSSSTELVLDQSIYVLGWIAGKWEDVDGSCHNLGRRDDSQLIHFIGTINECLWGLFLYSIGRLKLVVLHQLSFGNLYNAHRRTRHWLFLRLRTYSTAYLRTGSRETLISPLL